MHDYTIRPMDVSELNMFYQFIKQDFAAGEYAPYEILLRQFREGLLEGLVLCLDNQDLAYAICAAGSDYVLLSLMAVFKEFRGQGAGLAFLQALQRKYGCKQAIIGEVERPELASSSQEIKLRNWRIEFYKKAGFHLIQGVDYTIWDVPMYLIALPLSVSWKAINENIQAIMNEIYLQLMGKQFMHKMSLHRGTMEHADSDISLIAPCGMNCSTCLAYLREKNKCPGCRESNAEKPITRTRCKIKTCEAFADDGAAFCYECTKFPCDNLQHLDKRYRTKYNMSMIENLENIEKNGIENFIDSEITRWRCSLCGGTICVHEGHYYSCKSNKGE